MNAACSGRPRPLIGETAVIACPPAGGVVDQAEMQSCLLAARPRRDSRCHRWRVATGGARSPTIAWPAVMLMRVEAEVCFIQRLHGLMAGCCGLAIGCLIGLRFEGGPEASVIAGLLT